MYSDLPCSGPDPTRQIVCTVFHRCRSQKSIQHNKGEIFLNATDLLNTMVNKREIQGMGFRYTSADYYETQVIRIGYNYKF
ncbi:outer membrane beta-barrel family protein [Sphingobacterium sp. E70]|nr:outer membrane beta-barrel family protein [Sphingobacterium sp. E70]ULT29012.1 outer membrane beta-barrel family protein [Sphingobacterium sp. E70]